MIDILLKYILWQEFLNDLDAKSDFDEKVGQVEPFLSLVCSNYINFLMIAILCLYNF